MSKRSILVLVLPAALLLSACEFPGLATPTSDANLAVTQTAESISTLPASPSPQPTDTSEPPTTTPSITATLEATHSTMGSISGFAFYDGNNNGQYGDPQDIPSHEVAINLQQGDCLYGTPIIQTLTLYDGSYTFNNLSPDYYCIWAISPVYLPDRYEINLEPGQNVVNINFRTTP
jgi:hypothetical protein